MNWKDYGWYFGQVKELINASQNPRLARKFNVRVTWVDRSKGPCHLNLAAYAHGIDAPFRHLIHGYL